MSKTITPKSLTSDEAFRMGGVALAKVTRSRSTWTDEAKAVAQAEIDRRAKKPAAEIQAEPTLAEQVDAILEPEAAPARELTPDETRDAYLKAVRKVATTKAHELAGDGAGHMRRFVKER